MIEYVETNGLEGLGLHGIEVVEVTRSGGKVSCVILADAAGHTVKFAYSGQYPPHIEILIPKKEEEPPDPEATTAT